MKIHRFIGAFDLTQDRLTITDPNLVHQMGRVLRLQVGERIVLCDGNGEEIEGEIELIDKRHAIVKVQSRRQNITEPSTHVTLYLALIKRENFELAVQKATEVGVAEIVPIITERTVKTRVNLERLHVMVREAAEQSGRGRVPIVREPMTFAEACREVKEKEQAGFFFDVPLLSSRPESDGVEGPLTATCTNDNTLLIHDKGVPPLRNRFLFGMDTSVGTTKEYDSVRAVFIGPEGGWTDTERALAHEHKFATVSLGSRILRAETAAIIATHLLLT